MRALVTGGAGFIGSNLVDALVARGDDVAVVDDLSTGHRANLAGALAAGARLHEQDITDARALGAVFERERPQLVFHLAAQIDVRRSVAAPAADAHVNVEGTVNVLAAAHAVAAGRVVLSSTGGAIYGEADVTPTAEDAPIRPLSPYGHAKYCAEGYGDLFASLYGLPVVTLRYANVYGPRQDPLGEGGVIAILCGKAAVGATPTVFGDGRQTRDYVYVGDVVEANLRAAAAGEVAGRFNVGTGVETSVLDLVAEVGAFSTGETPFTPEFAPARAGEVLRSCLDVARIGDVLGWQPRTDLADGLRRTFAHISATAGAAASGQ